MSVNDRARRRREPARTRHLILVGGCIRLATLVRFIEQDAARTAFIAVVAVASLLALFELWLLWRAWCRPRGWATLTLAGVSVYTSVAVLLNTDGRASRVVLGFSYGIAALCFLLVLILEQRSQRIGEWGRTHHFDEERDR
jgi:hypothetical protein